MRHSRTEALSATHHIFKACVVWVRTRTQCWHCAIVLLLVLAGCPNQSKTKSPSGDTGSLQNVGTEQQAEQGLVDSSVMPVGTLFTDMTSRSSVEFAYRNGEKSDNFAILESLGGGVALFDYDNDGELDLFVPGGGKFGPEQQIHGHPPALFRNRGQWQFTEATDQAYAVLAPYFSHGAIVGDYNNDGFPDILVTGYGGVLLHQNQGDGTFREVSATAGLNDRLWSSSAAWGDFNSDGHLDLYVAHYVDWSFKKHPFCDGPKPEHREVCPPRLFEPLPDVLYFGNGDETFRDGTREAGLQPEGKGLGVVVADIDLDGDLDIYVSNDTVPNLLYRNKGQGAFNEVGLISGTSLSDSGSSDGSMGVDLGDYNLDGLPDLWVANYERESFALYRNEGNCSFQHVSQSMGVSDVGGLYVGWGTVFFDFDRDQDEDVFVSNGHVIRFPVNSTIRQRPVLFMNLAGKRFENVAATHGDYLTTPHSGRGVAVGDLDNDGDLDLAISHNDENEPIALLSNESENRNHWLSLRLVGTRSHRDAIGAIVRIQSSNVEQTRQIKGGTSYASSNDPRLFFGLGDADAVEKLEIRWPSGIVQTLHNLVVDRVLHVPEPSH